MNEKIRTAFLILAAPLIASCTTDSTQSSSANPMTFFVTSVGTGKGADLGGVSGADRHCQALAQAAGAGNRTWRAYVSTSAAAGAPAVNARDRIGQGPWRNAKGVVIARDVNELHSNNNINQQTALTEKGEIVPGSKNQVNTHDILTGSSLDGRAVTGGDDTSCANFTSEGAGSALVGHHDRGGGGTNPTSWNSAHPSSGCSQENLRSTGGDGLFYCFAI